MCEQCEKIGYDPVAEQDQAHAEIIGVRNVLTFWGEVGFYAQMTGDVTAALAAGQHAVAAFAMLGGHDQGTLINHMVTNMVALYADKLGGAGDWLEQLPRERRDWLAEFVATGGMNCDCELPHEEFATASGVWLPAHLTRVDVDGEPF